MNCEWRQKIALYADEELEPSAQEQVSSHLAGCNECAAALAEQLSLKKAVRLAANRDAAPPELHAAIYKRLHPHARVSPWWKWGLSAVSLMLLAALGYMLVPKKSTDPLLSELVDQHVTMLASANPVDVQNSDRHTVKPWFQGKLPFSFNLPELAGAPFTLLGGKAVYIQQKPGAELVYQAGRHKISIFIFQAEGAKRGPAGAERKLTFTFNSWRQGALEFYMVTDASQDEAGRLVTLFQEANRS